MPERMYKRFYKDISPLLTIAVLIACCCDSNSSAFSLGSPIGRNKSSRICEERGKLQTNLKINNDDESGDKDGSHSSLNLSRLNKLNKRLFKTSRQVAASDDIFSSSHDFSTFGDTRNSASLMKNQHLEIESQINKNASRVRKRDGVKYMFKSLKTFIKYFRVFSKDQPECLSQVITLVPTTWLKAHEQVVSEERVENLKEATSKWNAYKLPLLVDRKSGAILDGHHRYAVGRSLRLSRLPVVLVDYLDDDSISVDIWPGCGIDSITKEEVIQMSLSNSVFPPKTSKHDIGDLDPINVPLSALE